MESSKDSISGEQQENRSVGDEQNWFGLVLALGLQADPDIREACARVVHVCMLAQARGIAAALRLNDPDAPTILANEGALRLCSAFGRGRIDGTKGSVLDFGRGILRHVGHELSRQQQRLRRGSGYGGDLPADAPGPQESACRSEELAALRDAIERLEPNEKALLARRFGLLFGQGCASGTVRWSGREYVALHRLIRRLRRRFGETG